LPLALAGALLALFGTITIGSDMRAFGLRAGSAAGVWVVLGGLGLLAAAAVGHITGSRKQKSDSRR
jgi:hypothetical protein